MKYQFEISMIGELSFFLEIQVKQTDDDIFISKSKYARNLVKKFRKEGKTHAMIPMSTVVKISVNRTGKNIDPTLYKNMIESLLYITWLVD